MTENTNTTIAEDYDKFTEEIARGDNFIEHLDQRDAREASEISLASKYMSNLKKEFFIKHKVEYDDYPSPPAEFWEPSK